MIVVGSAKAGISKQQPLFVRMSFGVSKDRQGCPQEAMTHSGGIRSVELGVADLQKCVDFYERVWGLLLVERTSEAACLRGQGTLHHILELRMTGTPGIRRIVFDVPDAAALHELHGRLKRGVHPVSERPRQLGLAGSGLGFDARDPEGRNLSFACEVADHPASSQAPDRITKITHLNLNSATYDKMRPFMMEVLGLRVVDETRVNGFFNCGSDHHCIVIGRRQAPTSITSRLRCPTSTLSCAWLAPCGRQAIPSSGGSGAMGPGNNVFAYFAGPEEIPIECTAEVLQIDDTYRYRGPDEWSFPPDRTDQWGVTGPPSARIKRIKTCFGFQSCHFAEPSRLDSGPVNGHLVQRFEERQNALCELCEKRPILMGHFGWQRNH